MFALHMMLALVLLAWSSGDAWRWENNVAGQKHHRAPNKFWPR